jgi:hypothetical protein
MPFNIREDGLKLLTIVTPLFASSIAVIYDVGFFFGLDIGFFTFFTLSEHLVFALQAIPFAVPTALGIVGLIATTWWGHHKVIRDAFEAGEKAKTMTQAERDEWLTRLHRSAARYQRFDPWVKTAFALAANFVDCGGCLYNGISNVRVPVSYLTGLSHRAVKFACCACELGRDWDRRSVDFCIFNWR